MIRFRTTAIAWVLVIVAATGAEAQVEQGRFQVAAQGGWYAFDSGSALEGGFVLGADGTYFITPAFGIGVWSDYSFTETDGSMFPPAALSFVDSTTFTTINQAVELWQYGVHAKLQWPGRSTTPFVTVGVGGYTLFTDPEQSGGNRNTTGFVARFGAGLDLAVSETMGFQLSVSDAFVPSWRPEVLFPVREDFQNTRFPELNPDPSALEDSVHNLRFTVALTLIPGGGL